MFTDGLRVAQVVVGFDEAIEELLLPTATPDLTELEGPDLRNFRFNTLPREKRRGFRLLTLDERIACAKPRRGELDVTCAVEEEHQPSSHHGPQFPVCLLPVPSPAELLREPPSACAGMLGDDPPDGFNVLLVDCPPSVSDLAWFLHDAEG